MSTEALFYYRISQDKTGERLGVERQAPESEALCERLGFTPGKAFTDNDLSATTGIKRPAFDALLAELALRPRPVIVWHTDRLVRVTSDLERVIATGVNIHAVHAGHFDLSTPAGRAVARTLTAWAQYEGEQKAIRQQASNLQRAQAGRPWWPRRPFGLELDGTLRQDEAQALAECYAMLLAGSTVSGLAAHLNERGLQTNTGRPWQASSLRPVLLNARNAGIRTYNGQEIKRGAWDAIVPEDIYRQAVRLLTSPARRTGGGGSRQHLLTNIAVCDSCGGTMRVQWRGRRGEPGAYATYVCRDNHCCSHQVEWLDRYVRALAIGLLQDPVWVDVWSRAGGGDATEVRAEVVRLREKLEGLEEAWIGDDLTDEQFYRMSSRLKEVLGEAEDRLESMTGTSPIAGLLAAKDVAAAWGRQDLAAERVALRWLFDRLAVRPRGRGVRGSTDEHVVVRLRGQGDEGRLHEG